MHIWNDSIKAIVTTGSHLDHTLTASIIGITKLSKCWGCPYLVIVHCPNLSVVNGLPCWLGLGHARYKTELATRDGLPETCREIFHMNDFTRYLPLIGRILTGVPFIMSGTQKIFAYQATVGKIAGAGLPFAPLGWAIALVVEIGFGLLLVVGLRARPVAAVLAFWCLVTAVIFHQFRRSSDARAFSVQHDDCRWVVADRAFWRRQYER
jgi:uncharacterized membrane protein YphA (DoxX/SURF4 family)